MEIVTCLRIAYFAVVFLPLTSSSLPYEGLICGRAVAGSEFTGVAGRCTGDTGSLHGRRGLLVQRRGLTQRRAGRCTRRPVTEATERLICDTGDCERCCA